MTYKPDDYWESRLSKRFKLSGVGHIRFSEFYNKWLYRAKSRVLEKALRIHQPDLADKVVCDIGCGTGFFVEYYSRRGVKHITGIDITRVSVENLKSKYPHYDFITADISASSGVVETGHSFGLVNVFDILYHIKDGEAFKRAIANIAAMAENGALILATDVCGESDIDTAEHVEFRSKATYEEEFGKNGISIEAVYPLYYLLNRPIFGDILKGPLAKLGRGLDNSLAPLFYYLDGAIVSVKRSNLKLIVARKHTDR